MKKLVGLYSKHSRKSFKSMPCGKNALLLVSMQYDLEPQIILQGVLDLIGKFGDKEYAPNLSYQLNF